MQNIPKKHIKRSPLRKLLGRVFYTLKRYLQWYLPGTRFAKTQAGTRLPVRIFSHSSVLMRELKDVELWLQANKVINLRLALVALDGLVLRPGEVFSFWYRVGYPGARRGFAQGMVLEDGGFKPGVGGGLCQLSNLIYWMTLHSPLTVIERWRHSFDVFPDSKRSQPFGSGATCAYNHIDLQIKNNTDQDFQLKLKMDETHLRGEWLGEHELDIYYEVIEKNHAIKSEFWGGYSRNNEIYRNIIDKKTEHLLKQEFITKNRAIMMYEPLLEEKT